MKEGIKGLFLVFLAVFVLLVTAPLGVRATDDLNLAGTLKSVDAHSGTAVVEVTTAGCMGTRTFKVNDVSQIDHLVGQRISFYINSASCKDDTVYTMIPKGEKVSGGKRR